MKDKDIIEYGKLWVELAAIVKDSNGDKAFRSLSNDEVAINTSFLFKQMLKDISGKTD